MTRSVRLKTTFDEYDNTLGLKVKNTPGGDDTEFLADREGGLIAHDIIEHQNGAHHIGGVVDELEALGGIWHTRGRWGDFENTYHTPASHIASDIISMFHKYYWDPNPPRIPRTYRHSSDDDFDEIIEISRKELRREPEATPYELTQYLAQAKARLRIGYRKADRRFGPSFLSNTLYRDIKSAIQKFLKYNELYPEQELILTYSREKVTIRDANLSLYS